MSDLISIIVPVYNCSQYIKATLDSLKKQTYKNMEIIVIDDGSTDDTLRIVQEFADADSRFRVMHQENSGVSCARNVGMTLATGEYIGFVDGDDICDPKQFEILIDLMEKNQTQVAICALSFEYPNKTIVSDSSTFSESIIMDKYQAIFEMYDGKRFAGHLPNKLFRKSVIKDTFLDQDIYICEDSLFCLKCFIKADKIAYSRKPLYHYYMRTNSACHSTNIDRLFTSHISFERMEKILTGCQMPEYVMTAFYTSFMKTDSRLLSVLFECKKNSTPEYQIIKERLKGDYRKTYKCMPLILKAKMSIIINCYSLYRLVQKIKVTLKKKLRGQNDLYQ